MQNKDIALKGKSVRQMNKAAIKAKGGACVGCPKNVGFIVILSRNRPECCDQAKVLVNCSIFEAPVKPVGVETGTDYNACYRLVRYYNRYIAKEKFFKL